MPSWTTGPPSSLPPSPQCVAYRVLQIELAREEKLREEVKLLPVRDGLIVLLELILEFGIYSRDERGERTWRERCENRSTMRRMFEQLTEFAQTGIEPIHQDPTTEKK